MKRLHLLSVLVGIIVLWAGAGSSFAGPSAVGNFTMCNFGENVEQAGTIYQSADQPQASVIALGLSGQGTGSYQKIYTSTGNLDSSTFSYSITPNGMLTIFTPGGSQYPGILSPDGNLFAVAETISTRPFLNFAVKKSSGMSTAGFTGTYILAQFSDEITQSGSADSPFAELATITLDGQGNGTFQSLYSSTGEPDSGTFSYLVASDGTLTVNAGGGSMHGGVSPDGNIFCLSHTFSNEPGITIGVKKLSGLSNASLKGKYILAEFHDGITQPGSADRPRSMLSEISVDGQGNGIFQALSVSDGDLDSGTFTYTVAADGSLTINTGDRLFRGIVSSDGNVIAVALTSANEPGLFVGIKKSSEANLTPIFMLLE